MRTQGATRHYATRYYATVSNPDRWTALGDEHGYQPAAYLKANVHPHSNPATNKVICQACGKVATKARGGAILTRATVVCARCYDEAQHGPCSSVTRYGKEGER